MKLRPYLRGLGIGIIVTAIILHFSLKTANGASMTDSEIKARAAELGMIENTVLSNTVSQGSVSLNLSDDAEETTTETVSDVIDLALQGEDQDVTEDTEVADSDDETAEDTDVSDTEDTTSEDTPEDTSVTEVQDQDDTGSETVTPVDTPVNYVTITVVAGDSSYSVAKKVYDAGLITSAALFDEYLCAGGYDRSISIGQHRVPVDATDEEIAKILTSGD